MPSIKTTLFAVAVAVVATVSAAPNAEPAKLQKRLFDHGLEAVCSTQPNTHFEDTGVIPDDVAVNNDATIQCCMAQSGSKNTEEDTSSIHLKDIGGVYKMCVAGNSDSFFSVNTKIDRPKFLECCNQQNLRGYYSPSCKDADCSGWDVIKTIGTGVITLAPLILKAAAKAPKM